MKMVFLIVVFMVSFSAFASEKTCENLAAKNTEVEATLTGLGLDASTLKSSCQTAPASTDTKFDIDSFCSTVASDSSSKCKKAAKKLCMGTGKYASECSSST